MEQSVVGGGISSTFGEDVYAVITIRVKGNGAKIKIDPTDYSAYEGDIANPALKYSNEDIQRDMYTLARSFENYMKNTNDDW